MVLESLLPGAASRFNLVSVVVDTVTATVLSGTKFRVQFRPNQKSSQRQKPSCAESESAFGKQEVTSGLWPYRGVALALVVARPGSEAIRPTRRSVKVFDAFTSVLARRRATAASESWLDGARAGAPAQTESTMLVSKQLWNQVMTRKSQTKANPSPLALFPSSQASEEDAGRIPSPQRVHRYGSPPTPTVW